LWEHCPTSLSPLPSLRRRRRGPSAIPRERRVQLPACRRPSRGAERATRPAFDQIRAGDQPQDSQGARAHGAARFASADEVIEISCRNVAFWPEADELDDAISSRLGYSGRAADVVEGGRSPSETSGSVYSEGSLPARTLRPPPRSGLRERLRASIVSQDRPRKPHQGIGASPDPAVTSFVRHRPADKRVDIDFRVDRSAG
jgi:hypothetical protein